MGRGDTRHSRVIIGYTAKTSQAITTYEYQAPHGLNHGLADMHDELMKYLVPPMLEDASASPCIRSVRQMQLLFLERRVKLTKGEAEIEANVLRAKVAGLQQGLNRAQLEREQMEQQRDEAHN